MALHFARIEHHLLAIANLEAFLLQCKQHRRLADIQPQRHVGDAFFF